MTDKAIFESYLLALRKTRIDEKTEHTDRAALQSLLRAFADESGVGEGRHSFLSSGRGDGLPSSLFGRGGASLEM